MQMKCTGRLAAVSGLLLLCSHGLADQGQQFLAENAKKQGVISTSSGLQYRVIRAGKGKAPKATDMVRVHYHGTLIDGTVFDSSVERGTPSSFALNQVIRGWTEGLQSMQPGGKSILYVPPELGYGDSKVGTIPPNSTLIFEVELLDVIPVYVPEDTGQALGYKAPPLACGNAPELDSSKPLSEAKRTEIDHYLLCASDYIKLVNLEFAAVYQVASSAAEQQRNEILDRIKLARKDAESRLEPATALLKQFKDAQNRQ